MCGRFSIAAPAGPIENRFDVEIGFNYTPRFNCAPTQNLPVISDQDPGKLSLFRWGLIPVWAKDKKIGNNLINARAETIAEKPAFKNSFRRKRCLVPADGFYEWKRTAAKQKTPYRIMMKDESLFAMAGIWDSWKDEGGGIIHSFSIITTAPNELMRGIHDRMPVILERKDEKTWLQENDQDVLNKLLKPFSSEMMKAYPVSTLVNSPANDVPEVMTRVEF
jgi:putative SOS response-associated peptidase YedK